MSEDMTPLDRLVRWQRDAASAGAQGKAAGARRLVRQHDLAQDLGVSDKRVATWRTRSAVNGFPEPVACNVGPVAHGGKRRHMLWDLGEVREWFSRYDERAQRGRRGPHQRRSEP